MNLCSENEPFALMVLGDDMAPEFAEGDIITIDPGYPLVNGAYAVIETPDDVYFRLFVSQADKSSFLRALKAETPDIVLNRDDWQLKGVVVQSARKRQITHYEYANGKVLCQVKQRGTKNIQL